MLTNYFKTALRAMRRNWSSTTINVVGLSVGFLTSFLILLWVQDEMSFNSHYEESELVHRVMRTAYFGDGQVFTIPAIPANLDDVLDEEYPGIELASLVSWTQNMAFRQGEVMAREEGVHAGPDFFRILSHEFLSGDPETVLQAPDAVVLSVSMARKYFPDAFRGRSEIEAAAAIVGSPINLENRLDLTVTGVYQDIRPQATYRPDYVVAMEEYASRNDWIEDWGNNGLNMLVKLTPQAVPANVQEDIKLLIQDHTSSETDVLFLQPLSDVHLRSNFENGALVGGRIDYIRIFSIVGFFILLIAAINFTNLSTAQAVGRAREVGVRKTFGSGRGRLAGQFLSESVITAFVAFGLAAIAVILLMKGFNSLTSKQIAITQVSGATWGMFALIAALTGLAAGSYPAAYLSSFSVIGVLRGSGRGVGGGTNLRRSLVVFQFVLSTLLIIGAGTVSSQLDYIQNKNLGLDRSDVFSSSLDGDLASQYESFRLRMLESPAIESVSFSSSSPLEVGSSTAWGVRWEGREADDNTLFNILSVGHDYVPTMRMELESGRDFSREFVADSTNIVINQAAARAMGFDDPLGQTVRVWGRTGQIIGVVKDFHFDSMYNPIDPLVMRMSPSSSGHAFLRPTAGQTEQALAHFGAIFAEYNPQSPVETRFMDTQFQEMYQSESVIQALAGWFMSLAIFVACLGLFGLASFTAARRTKEIGVRKVLGASVPRIVAMLSSEFVGLVVVAFAIAVPISRLMTGRWLAQFEYHVAAGWTLYFLAGAGVIALTYATVGYQAVKAALVNPAETLRAE